MLNMSQQCDLLSIGEATARVLGSVLGTSVQERPGYAGECPTEGHKNDLGLEYTERLRLLSLEKRWHRGSHQYLYIAKERVHRGCSWALLNGAQCQDKRP